MPMKELIVPQGSTGKRVADCVRSALPDLPESMIRRIFDNRDVKLDGLRVSRGQIVTAGQTLKIFVPDQLSSVSY